MGYTRAANRYPVFLRTLLTVMFLFVSSAIAIADTIYLKNGRSIDGFIKKEDEDGIELDIGFGTIKFRPSQIERIYKSTSEESDVLRQEWEKNKAASEKRAQEEKARKALEPKKIELTREQGHIIVDAILNKDVKATLLLDTGASLVVLSNSVAKKLGIEARVDDKANVELILADGRKMGAKYAVLKNISVQGVEAEDVPVAFMSEDMEGAAYKDGLLGMSFLNRFNFKVDQKNNKLILERLQ